jgi:hypothetical protein
MTSYLKMTIIETVENVEPNSVSDNQYITSCRGTNSDWIRDSHFGATILHPLRANQGIRLEKSCRKL